MQLSTQFSSKVSIPVLLILVIQNGLMEWYGKRGTDFGQQYIYIYDQRNNKTGENHEVSNGKRYFIQEK